MQVVLVMFRPDGQRRSFSVVRDMTVIGRREDCDLRIPLGDVSRKHCRLIKDDQALRVEDLGSSNGTYINGQRVQQAELSPGDTLQVGPVVFVLQVDGVPADEELQPVLASAAAPAEAEEAEEDLAVVEEEGASASAVESEPGEFDPMEALNAAEGSGFEFQIEEELAAAAAARGGEEGDVQVDLGAGEEAPALEEAGGEEGDVQVDLGAGEDAPVLEEAGAELDETPAEEAPAELEEAPAELEEVPAELDEAPAELDEVTEDLDDAPVDLEESEHDQKA